MKLSLPCYSQPGKLQNLIRKQKDHNLWESNQDNKQKQAEHVTPNENPWKTHMQNSEEEDAKEIRKTLMEEGRQSI